MVRKVLMATVLSALVAAPGALAVRPPSGELQAIMQAHPGGKTTLVAPTPGAITPEYVYGQPYCYTNVGQELLGTAGGLAQEGLYVRPYWCAVAGLPPHLYTLDNHYRYQICTGLIQCAGTQGPFLGAGGLGWSYAMWEWVGNFHWDASGISASAQVHLAWEVYEDGSFWAYGWT
jgi:hypothetical protein